MVMMRHYAVCPCMYAGVSKVFSGHQPHGDSPVIMTAAAAAPAGGGEDVRTDAEHSRVIQVLHRLSGAHTVHPPVPGYIVHCLHDHSLIHYHRFH